MKTKMGCSVCYKRKIFFNEIRKEKQEGWRAEENSILRCQTMHRASVSQFIRLKFICCFIRTSLTLNTWEYLASYRWCAGGK